MNNADHLDHIKQSIVQLRTLINKYNQEYYVEANPSIDDYSYDRLIRMLQELETKYPQFADSNSPTKHVGDDRISGFVDVKHSRPMLSLCNTYSIDEARKFVENIKREIPEAKFVVEHKIDGLSIACRYKHGCLYQAITRGNGDTGSDVTDNVMYIDDIPKVIVATDLPEILEIRGEIFMAKSDFIKLNQQRVAQGEPLFANPRNIAAGTVKSFDKSIIKSRKLSAVFYDIGDTELVKSQCEMFKLFDKLHIPHAIYFANKSPHQSDAVALASWLDKIYQLKEYVDFPVDGAVIKLDNFAQRKRLGSTSKYPKWARAYKFEPEDGISKVRNIILTVGRTGIITPVAEIDPIELSGSTINKVTLHNEDFIKKLDLRIGDTVRIKKAGEIIPEIIEVVNHSNNPRYSISDYTNSKCPVCGEVIARNEEAAWRCLNPNCTAQLERQLVHFAAKDALDIDGLGDAIATALVSSGLVKQLLDIFKLSSTQLMSLKTDGVQLGVNGLKLFNAINQAQYKPLSRWLYALGIPDVGKTTAIALANEYKSLSALYFSFTPRADYVVDQSVATYINSDYGKNIISTLLSWNIDPVVETNTENILTGKTFVITGTIVGMSRHALVEMIQRAGGKVSESVSTKTAYVICDDPTSSSSKSIKAKQLNIPIITSNELLQTIK